MVILSGWSGVVLTTLLFEPVCAFITAGLVISSVLTKKLSFALFTAAAAILTPLSGVVSFAFPEVVSGTDCLTGINRAAGLILNVN